MLFSVLKWTPNRWMTWVWWRRCFNRLAATKQCDGILNVWTTMRQVILVVWSGAFCLIKFYVFVRFFLWIPMNGCALFVEDREQLAFSPSTQACFFEIFSVSFTRTYLSAEKTSFVTAVCVVGFFEPPPQIRRQTSPLILLFSAQLSGSIRVIKMVRESASFCWRPDPTALGYCRWWQNSQT